RGARVVVCGPASTDELFGFGGPGVRFAEVDIADRPRPVSDARAVARLRSLVSGADVVHAHGLRAGALAAAACARIAPGPRRFARGGTPLVVTLHNAVIAGGRAAAVYGALGRGGARGAACVRGVSPDLAEGMRSLGAPAAGRGIVPAPAPAGADGRGLRGAGARRGARRRLRPRRLARPGGADARPRRPVGRARDRAGARAGGAAGPGGPRRPARGAGGGGPAADHHGGAARRAE